MRPQAQEGWCELARAIDELHQLTRGDPPTPLEDLGPPTSPEEELIFADVLLDRLQAVVGVLGLHE